MTRLYVDTIERLFAEIMLDLTHTPFGIVVTLVLVSLLTLQELLRAHQGNRARRLAEVLKYVTYPLLVVFSLTVVVRVLQAVKA
jgi:hypothetical protein